MQKEISTMAVFWWEFLILPIPTYSAVEMLKGRSLRLLGDSGVWVTGKSGCQDRRGELREG